MANRSLWDAGYELNRLTIELERLEKEYCALAEKMANISAEGNSIRHEILITLQAETAEGKKLVLPKLIKINSDKMLMISELSVDGIDIVSYE